MHDVVLDNRIPWQRLNNRKFGRLQSRHRLDCEADVSAVHYCASVWVTLVQHFLSAQRSAERFVGSWNGSTPLHRREPHERLDDLSSRTAFYTDLGTPTRREFVNLQVTVLVHTSVAASLAALRRHISTSRLHSLSPACDNLSAADLRRRRALDRSVK